MSEQILSAVHGVTTQCWELSVNLRTLNRFTCSLKIK